MIIVPICIGIGIISFEKYPLSLEDLTKTLKNIKRLKGYKKMLTQYNPCEGLNIFRFNNITLKLIIGDINSIDFYQLPLIDAWFLDGFAPAKNASMWTDKLFKNMQALSKKGSTFATFTASSMVRKLLQKNGFGVKKDTGFGKKREMMYGNFIGQIAGQHA